MKIGIIGAGAAGLAALRHSLEQGHECVVFEKTSNVGGTWVYTDLTDVDEYGLPVHSSMYQGLKTNLPKELMEYQDFPYEERGKSFVDQPSVLEYIQKFASHYNLQPHIKFKRHVTEVTPIFNEKWSLKEQNLENQIVTQHTLDALIICVGNYSVPRLPNIPGSENFKKKAIHSHHYRKPDGFRGKKVLIIGAGPSGIDIARIVGGVAKEVYLSYGNTVFLKTPAYVVHKPLVKKFENDKAIFVDGSSVQIDNIIYCTGYQYSYPFLSPNCGISIENNWVKYLYKHIVNVEHPTMGFIGITFRVCPFPTFDVQVRFYLEFLKHPSRISKQEMMSDILNDVNKRKELNMPMHYVHKIGMELHQEYFDDLTSTVKIKKVRPVIHRLYSHLMNNRNVDKRCWSS